ncbi:MAG: S-layer homology domain-containing protein, partial [Acidimicrobiales bacterium]
MLLPIATFAGAFAMPATSTASAASSNIETREQFIVNLAQQLNLQPDTTATQVFSDVPPSNPDFGYVMAASKAGWISGFPGGTFQPNGSLTREQIAKVEILALGLQAQATTLGNQRPSYSDAGTIGQWAWGYVNEATAIGILQGFVSGTFGPASTFTTDQETHAISQLEAYVKAHAKLAVTAVTPSSGPVAGGTSVTITGIGFTGATAVQFGTTAATSFTVTSDTSITATAPAGTGTVDVTVTTPNGTSATNSSDQFSYAAPAVTLVPTTITATPSSPTAVTAGGSETVTFTVTNQYGGVMSGETVDFHVTGTLKSSGLSAPSDTTNGSGQVTVTYTDSTAGDSGTVTGTVAGYTSVTTATAFDVTA